MKFGISGMSGIIPMKEMPASKVTLRLPFLIISQPVNGIASIAPDAADNRISPMDPLVSSKIS